MRTIAIKSNSPDTVIPMLSNAIEREKRILMDTLRMAREKVGKMAENLHVDIEKLMKGEVEHTDSNDMMLIEIEGELEVLRHLEKKLKELNSVQICE